MIKNIISAMIFIILTASVINAFGVSSPYWDENPLVIERGETATVNLNLQNMAEDKDVKVMAEVVSGSEITSLEEDTFIVKAGTSDTTVPLTVKMPEDASPGETTPIKIEFKTIEDNSKGISMATGMTVFFDVIAGQEIKDTRDSSAWVGIGIGAIILAVILWVIIKKIRKR